MPDFLSYTKAQRIARSLKLKSYQQWREYAKSGKKPANIPADPLLTYEGKGWKTVGPLARVR